MRIFKKFALQFGKPEGLLGRIVGKLMVSTGVKKNKWTISLLIIQRADHVLEIGFGPGVATELVSKLKQAGFSNIRMELKEMKPVTAVCVLGINK